MAASVKIRLGNLFDGPSDMIVLPCATVGAVTGFVARSLDHYSLPHPKPGMKLGQVEIMPFEGGENIAQFVAFAASVAAMTSTASAIKEIGSALGRFTTEQASVRVVNVPLLGAGAGGLQSEEVVRALKEGFCNTAHADAVLNIFVLHKEVFDRLRGNKKGIAGRRREAVRVFVSHTSSDNEAVNWVKELALFLIDHGIQARLDKFHLRRGMDLPQWMCNELALAQKVVIVCDEQYKKKADGRLGGVGWETMIIQGDISCLPADSIKYQVVVREENLGDGLPMYLKTRYVFHARPSDNSQLFREELVRELLELPLDERLEAREFSV
ncbi:toll/interleukin-1 receptor domain-containing protein [Collimonas silvisoli]|uniref:toll/interleukin-1 receptor domain-containing protein n=1 Tax=Collimonas silvisoli TaxID=2825884 RepID=UPI001B8CC1C6|nr:toll/interleukin-1 receptor domain-containing protein [Collimonas silvisoli]